MGWTVKAEHPEHFEVHGSVGPFMVRKSALSPVAAARMRAMCQGGPVKMATGGAVQRLAEGEEVERHADAPTPDPYYEKWLASRAADRAAMEAPPTPAGSEPLAELGGISPRELAAQVGNPPPGAPPVGAAPAPMAAHAPAAAPSAAGQAAPGAPPGQAPMPPMPGLPPMANWGKLEKNVQAGLQAGTEAADLRAKAEAQQAADLTQAYGEHVKALKTIEDHRLVATATEEGNINRVMADIEGAKIDPSHFWSTRSTGQKIAAGIGMILSGMGSGITGGPNLAAQFIQRSIEQDIEAQKANLDKKQNLVSFFMKKYGNVQAASQAAAAYQLSSLAGQVGLAGARAGNQTALANAAALKSQLLMSANGIMAQIVQGQHQDAMQRYQLLWQQRLFSQLGSGGQGGGGARYVPSAASPVFTGDPGAFVKAQQEQRLDWIDAQGNRLTSHGKPGQAKDAQTTLGGVSEMRSDLAELEKIANSATTGLVPWTEVRSKWDALQGHFETLAPSVLADIKRVNPEMLDIAKGQSGESIWKTKLHNGAALKVTRDILQRRQDATLRGQGVDERYLGEGGPPSASPFAPVPVR